VPLKILYKSAPSHFLTSLTNTFYLGLSHLFTGPTNTLVLMSRVKIKINLPALQIMFFFSRFLCVKKDDSRKRFFIRTKVFRIT
jgi:hypothetical protein